MENRPLKGYKVVELSTFVAAPACGKLFADWGADVIKIETSEGDAWRTFGSTHRVTATEEEKPMFDLVNGGKKSISLNLKSEEGKEILFSLLKDADVFLTNTRAQSLRKMQIDYDSIKERFPRLIYATITGFGETGPQVDHPGFDVVAYWGSSGFLNDLSINTGSNYPILAPTGIGDVTCGTGLFGGVCAALLARERTGRGDYVTVSLYGGAIWIMGFMYLRAQEQYGDPFPKQRKNSPPMTAPYRCKDGEWLMLSILQFERYFPSLCLALGIPETAQDPRFADRKSMDAHREELFAILEERFLTKTCSEWQSILTSYDIVNDRLKHFKDVVKSEQAWVNHYFTTAKFASGRECAMPCSAIQSHELGVVEYTRAPLLAENTEEILREHGYCADEIDGFLQSGAVKVHP